MHLSQTIQKKLSSDKTNRFSDSSPEKVSDGNLFITQRFPGMANKKPKDSRSPKKKNPDKLVTKKSKSGSAATDNSSGSDSDNTENVSQNKNVKKKIFNSAKQGKTRKNSTSSSASESDSSLDIDKAKFHSLAEKLRAKTARKNDSESSDLESESSPTAANDSDNQQKENDDVNFSQDLFSQVTRHSGTESSDSERKSSKQQKGKSETIAESRKKERRRPESVIQDMFGPSPSKQQKSKSKTLKENKDISHKLGKSDNKSAEKQQRKRSAHDLSLSESYGSESEIANGKAKATKKRLSKTSNKLSDSDLDSHSASKTNKIPRRAVDFNGRRDSGSGADSDSGPRDSGPSGSEDHNDTDEENATHRMKKTTGTKNQSVDSDSDTNVSRTVSLKRKKSNSATSNSSKSDLDSDNSDASVEKTSRTARFNSPKSSTPSKINRKSKKLDSEEEHTAKIPSLNSPKSSDLRNSSKETLKSPETPRQAMRQSKITDHCSPAAESCKKISGAKKRELRYEAPDFETHEDIHKYVTETEIQGKQLWLIQTPVDFDIRVLDDKKVKLEGIQAVCVDDETEKQYEVLFRPYEDKQGPGYSSVVIDDKGDHKLGERMCGQIQVMDWIPGACIPPVTVDIPTHQKHEVPDNLKARYVPFGAESPKRIDNADLHGKRSKKKHERSHSEGKKKKKKDKKVLYDL